MRKRIFRAIAVTALSITLTIVFSTNLPSFKGVFDLLDGDQNQETEENVEPLRGGTRSISDYSSQTAVVKKMRENSEDTAGESIATSEDLAGDSLSFELLDGSDNTIDFLMTNGSGVATTTGSKLKVINNSSDRTITITDIHPNQEALQDDGISYAFSTNPGSDASNWDISHNSSKNISTSNYAINYMSQEGYTPKTEIKTVEIIANYTIDGVYDGDSNNLKIFTQKTYIPILGRVADTLAGTHTLNVNSTGTDRTGARLQLDITDSLLNTALNSSDFRIIPRYDDTTDGDHSGITNYGGEAIYSADLYVNTSVYPTFDDLNFSLSQVYTYDHGGLSWHVTDAFTWFIRVNNNITIDIDGNAVQGDDKRATIGSGQNAITVYESIMDRDIIDACTAQTVVCTSRANLKGLAEKSADTATISLSGKIPEAGSDGKTTLKVEIPIEATNSKGSGNNPNVTPTTGYINIILNIYPYTTDDKTNLRNKIDTKTSVIDYSSYDSSNYYNSIKEGKQALANIERTSAVLSNKVTNINTAITALEAGVFASKNIIEQNHLQKVSDLNSANNQTETVYRVYDKNATYILPYKESFKYSTDTSQQGKFTNTLTGTITENLTAEYDYWKINLTDLNTAISNAEAKIADPDGIYTDNSKQALQDRIDEIKADIASLENINNSPTSQSEINALTSEINNYQLEYKTLLSFYDEDGTTLLKEVRTAQGETTLTALGVSNPTKEPTKEKQYEFNGWVRQSGNSTINGDQITVDDDTVFKASYSDSNRRYHLEFYNYNSVTGQNDDPFCDQEVVYSEPWTPCYTSLSTPERDPTTESVFTFQSWYPDVPASPFTVSGTGVPTRFEARYTASDRPYNVYFHNGDGSILQAFDEEHGNQILYGTTPEYTGSIVPSKQATAQYTYTFSGDWDPEIKPVTGNIDYDPIFNETVNEYTITFKNYDGATLETKQVAYGETPTYTGQTPEKPADDQWIYNFAGWNPEISAVSCSDDNTNACNQTYTAQFEHVAHEYDVIIKNRGVTRTDTLAYGATVNLGLEETSDYQTNDTNYEFKGWSCYGTNDHKVVDIYGFNYIDVEKNTTCEASYKETTRKYTISLYNTLYNDYGETVPNYIGQNTNYEYEDEVEFPNLNTFSTETKYYILKGWAEYDPMAGTQGEVIEGNVYVTDNMTFIAVYEEHTFKTITFVDYDNTPIFEDKYRDGATVTVPADPTRDADEIYTYTFAGWTPEITTVSADATYTATYTPTYIDYAVTFNDYDGTEISATNYHYGDTVIAPADPTRDADETYTYTFAGWTPEVTEVTSEATYTATYTPIYIDYTVIFNDYDGTEIASDTYHYNDDFTVPTDPTRAADETYTYEFAAWDPTLPDEHKVTSNVTYTATYTPTYIEYAITFNDYDGTEISTTNYHYGDTVIAPADPTRDATAQYTYTFTGWDPEITSVTGEATYTATYNSTVNQYNITFVDEDGAVLKEATAYDYGTQPDNIAKPADPTKDATAQYTYTFAGWSPEIAEVTGEATYTATYSSTVNKYTIKFVNDDGTELQSGEVEYGQTPAYTGETPTKDATAQYTYAFNGWDPEIAEVTGEATYTATYSSTVNEYTITFNDADGNALQTSDVAYGETPAYTGETPTKPATAQYTYTFTGWDPEITSVTGVATYNPVFSSTVNEYTIKFVDENGTELQSTKVPYGETPAYGGETPTKESTPKLEYTFDGWDKEVTAVTGDETYTAKYTGKAYDVDFEWLENQIYTIGEDNEAIFHIEIARKFFAHRVEVDDKVITENTDYVITDGSTKVTLKKSFLDTLAVGIHTLDVYYDEEVVISTTFEIKEESADVPDTGDDDSEKDSGKEDGKKDSDKDGSSSDSGKSNGSGSESPDTGFFTETTDFAKLSIVLPILIVTTSAAIIVRKKTKKNA